MSKPSQTLTQRIGGNKTLVLGVMIFMLVIFTVASDVMPAFGMRSRGADYLTFTVNGRTVSMPLHVYDGKFTDWLKYQNGIGRGRGGSAAFLEELMLAEMGRDAGLTVTDGTLLEAIRANRAFHDFSGEFDDKTFLDVLTKGFGGLTRRAFEEQLRFSLLVDHVRRLYVEASGSVDDEEVFRRWRGNYPKVEVAFAWKPVGPVRETMKAGDLKDAEIEAYWKSPGVQDRHRLPKRFSFEAAVVLVDEVQDKAYLEAREAWKGEADLALKKEGARDEAYDGWAQNRRYEFDISEQDPATLEKLRAENADAVKAEDEAKKKEAPAPGAGGDPPPEVDLSKVAPENLEEHELYRRYWRFRVEKDLWLQKLVKKVLKEATDGKKPFAEVAPKWSRPGLEVRVHRQEEPLDQYGVERIPRVGFEGCDLRFSLNGYKPEQAGTYHGEVHCTTSARSRLPERGWLAFRVLKVVPDDVPPLESVKARVAEELLDERAKDRTRADLEALRKSAEDARKSLEDAAKEQGYESSQAGPFNAFSWRPPAPKPAEDKSSAPANPGERKPWVPPTDWKDANRRTAYLMSRYSALRDTPVGAFGPVLDDSSGTGAFYLAQVKSREEPKFEEMTAAQRSSGRRLLAQERVMNLNREMSYAKLKTRFGLRIRDAQGEMSPAPDEERGR
jgi:hypothetical protein